MAKLYFRYGAMGSSKSANAIMVQYNYRERGQNALMLKPRLDQRDGDRIVGSRSGLSAPCLFVEDLDTVNLDNYACVIVDEAQFLTKDQVWQLSEIADTKNIPVICYGLRADFRGNLFEGSTWLLAWADTIEEIKTVCWCGRKATYNARVIDGQVAREGEQIVLGGNESYVALCRRHWKSGELAPMEVRKVTYQANEVFTDISGEPAACLAGAEMYVLSLHGEGIAEAVIAPRGETESELRSICVREAYRHKGYGSQLLGHMLHICAPQCRRVAAKIPGDVMPFFARAGFEAASDINCDTFEVYKEL